MESLGTMYQTEGGDTIMQQHGMSLPDGLWAYMAQAREAMEADGV